MPNKKIAYLTDSITTMELSAGDDLFLELLKDKVHFDIIPWEEEKDYSQYTLTLVRTTWDYMNKPEKFLETLEKISRQSRLINPLETILWNINKKYLLEVEKLGFPIIPTSLHSKITNKEVQDIFTATDQGEGIIIKPTIGASSVGIQFLSSPTELEEIQSGEWFVQPFQKSIQVEGEFSLFFFGGKFSHAINKMPKVGEFRSQEEFDSIVTNIKPTNEMSSLGENVLAAIPVTTEYARVDLILDKDNQPQIVELELIEPCLFLKYDQNAPKNFTRHIHKLLEAN